MANKTIKEAILNSFEQELDQWLKEEETFTNGYDYETAFVHFIQRVGKNTIQLSQGKMPKSRNSKKNFTPVLATSK